MLPQKIETDKVYHRKAQNYVQGKTNCFFYNQFHNILTLFDVLPNFPFTRSETMGIITYKHDIYELPHEFAKD